MNPDNTNIKSDPANVSHEDEIDLIQLAKTLWEGRRTVIKTTLIFMVLGLFIAIFSAKEYTASTTMVPQVADGGAKLGGNLGGLAAMAGIDLGGIGGGSNIAPSLYPKIINSIPFQKELMKTELIIDGQVTETTFSYYYENIYSPGLFGVIKEYTIGLPRLILKTIKRERIQNTSLISNHQIIEVSEREKELIERLEEQLTFSMNDKDGDITLSASMPEAIPAAQLVEKAKELLQKSITNFKIQKAEDQLAFVKERYTEKEKEVHQIQKKLAEFRDRNKNVSTAIAQAEQQRLTAEYNLVYGVYSELAKQLETQKIQVKEDTPIFTVIQPTSIPIKPSSQSKLLTLVIFCFLGGIVGVVTVFAKKLIGTLKNEFVN
ncbi:Wzz/FepE/Etk N-terminal domain-containing protein [Labilibaculum sp. DW002]|uniref:Wzz/FepE/Etk N-terminal domain-containing protein n=1 Tax=Paralabilibaculum antarcticum TaxID=2912572 RepID=A0ABT5VP75_9BACT|nr:Wzz/FepE/Etk N-terminal domain-containing protein [Labilibaculum sp. DW002]MDE5417234.1 Wzz/FepE/Etk N-terminal domain-containing protein [Labilibaculum sp. DW002]